MEITQNTKLYLISGYTQSIGSWEIEIFANQEDAVNAFNQYVIDEDAVVSHDDDWYAETDHGYGYFRLEERDLYPILKQGQH